MKRRRAIRMPANQGPAAWNIILDRQTPAKILDTKINADFVIIGAGFAGLSAARRLTQLQPGARIVVLEAVGVAEGAAGRNSGFMIDLPHDLASDDYAGDGSDVDRIMIGLNRQAIDFARAAVEEYDIDRNYFDPVGKVNGAASPLTHTHNINYAAHLQNLDETSEMLDSTEMAELSGSHHYISGLYTPGTVMLQPAGFIRGLADGLQRQVEIYQNSPVEEFSRIGCDWRVSTPKGAVITPRIILTNNGHLESFGFERGRLMQLFLYASMTTEMDAAAIAKLGGQPRWGITPSDPMGTTLRRIDSAQGGNRIVTRTCATLRSDMIPKARDVKRAARVHQQKFDQRFPQLAGMKMEHCWAGHLCLSLNGVSVMRELDKGVFSGCVQNGLGTTRGTLTGIGAAELACGETSDITKYFVAQRPPKSLPPKPFAQIGVNAYLKWKEWRAMNE